MRFGKPFTCDRDGVVCFKCRKPVCQGEDLRWEFEGKHRYCVPCADTLETTPQTGGVDIAPLMEQLAEVKQLLKDGLARIEQALNPFN